MIAYVMNFNKTKQWQFFFDPLRTMSNTHNIQLQYDSSSMTSLIMINELSYFAAWENQSRPRLKTDLIAFILDLNTQFCCCYISALDVLLNNLPEKLKKFSTWMELKMFVLLAVSRWHFNVEKFPIQFWFNGKKSF